ncbi:DUF3854 domain-containing protein [Oceanobacillus kimchii]|uniref:DUF3854 domain-containing protein n=1 Tax=Oceanobacillus kimchii TaxID=746691 RepID=A0ABQ5TS61_9BACI|nr:DUF3854 domain-containing protein [Oceanobacillus kimchii]GLO68305.1 hypothetical protein MACH08_40890 [Oceanobacillus kimchii]
MKDYRSTRIPNFFEFIRIACPICGHTGGCMVNSEGDRVACIRIESDRAFSKNSALPSWLHFLRRNKQQKIEYQDIEEMGNKKLSDEELNEIYSNMLDYMELTEEHYSHLTSPSRGLNEEQIITRAYMSFPNSPWSLARTIQNDLGIDSFAGVPGFYEAKGKKGSIYWSISGQKGILLPYRNVRNEITGFQYRLDNPPPIAKVKQLSGIHGLKARNDGSHVTVIHQNVIVFEQEMMIGETKQVEDLNGKLLGFVTLKKGTRYFWLSSAKKKNGTGSGSPNPVHVSIPSNQLRTWKPGQGIKRKIVWLTEGPLKADISSDMIHQLYSPEQIALYGDTFIAIPGVNSWQTVIPVLEELGVEEINLAFDRDFSSNKYVMNSLKEFMGHAKKLGYHINMVSWGKEDGKGIDDLFVSQRKIPTITPIF